MFVGKAWQTTSSVMVCQPYSPILDDYVINAVVLKLTVPVTASHFQPSLTFAGKTSRLPRMGSSVRRGQPYTQTLSYVGSFTVLKAFVLVTVSVFPTQYYICVCVWSLPIEWSSNRFMLLTVTNVLA